MRICLISVIFLASIPCLADQPISPAEPQIVDGQIVWPDGYIIPRYETDIEKKFRAIYGDAPSPRAATPAPSGPLHCVAEYEPMEGILVNWVSFPSIHSAMIKEITTTANTLAYVVVSNSATQTSATNTLTSAGANMSKVRFLITASNTVWIRDYGPRYCYEGQCRVVVDHEYNRPRPQDNVVPQAFANYKHHKYYEMQNLYGNNQLIHGGGNYHLDALGRGYATRLTVNENPLLGANNTQRETNIIDIWGHYWGVNHTFFDPFPTSVDITQHLDMWMQIIDDNKVIIGDWPNNPGSTQDNICDAAATTMTGLGYTVYRVPNFLVGGVHYSYTNSVMCNNIVMIPSYTNGTVSPSNATALATFQNAMPGKTIIPVACESIIGLAGAIHCIVMHIPVPLGGTNPTAYLRNYRGGETVASGQSITINWISDDDVAAQNADILMSTDSGATWPTTIVAATADDGSHTFSVPGGPCTTHARFRVVVRDGDGNTGYDSSASDLTITGQPCLGDMNCDGLVNLNDVGPMVQALTDPAGYAIAFPGCSNGDMNLSTQTDGDDVQGFVAAVLNP